MPEHLKQDASPVRSDALRITSIRVHGLFGSYNYSIELPVDRPITVITAPNGFGKSTLLRLLNAFSNKEYDDFFEIPFEWFEVKYGIDAVVRIEVHGSDLHFKLYHIKDNARSDSLNGPWIHRRSRDADVSSRHWRIMMSDPLIARNLANRNLRNRLAHSLDSTWQDLLAAEGKPTDAEEPAQLKSLREQSRVRLIPVQRLQTSEWASDGREKRAESAVSEIANRVKVEIDRGRVRYGEQSRSQEKTFVTRAIENLASVRQQPDIEENSLIEQIRAFERKYQRLALIEPGETQSVERRGSSQEEQVLVRTYLSDVIGRFESLSPIAASLEIFLDTLSRLLQRKRVELSKDHGILFFDLNNRAIPLERISSGEQHLVVLLGLLIFSTDSRDLILIDEPEVSLHPGWQEQLLPIFGEIARLNKCRLALATHSVLLINGQWDVVTELAEQVS